MRLKTFILLYKKTLLFAVAIILSALLIAKFVHIKKEHHAAKKIERTIYDCDRSLYATVPIESVRLLNDKNDYQNLHAQANGLKKIYITNAEFEEDSTRLVKEGILVHLRNNPLYHVKEMTHSYPFTTPEMADLLNTIGYLFHQKLKAKNKDIYRFLITSALRTNETQQDLTSRNRNASTQSAHLFGATIDITYKEFYNIQTDSLAQDWYASDALRETMLDLREECRLVAVRERRQAVYHFTVVNCDPAKAPSSSMNKKILEH